MHRLNDSIRGKDTSVASSNTVTEAGQTDQLEKTCLESQPVSSIKANDGAIKGAASPFQPYFYKGEKDDYGNADGQGTLFLANKTMLKCSFINGKADGIGIFELPRGDLLQCQLIDGKADGQATLHLYAETDEKGIDHFYGHLVFNYINGELAGKVKVVNRDEAYGCELSELHKKFHFLKTIKGMQHKATQGAEANPQAPKVGPDAVDDFFLPRPAVKPTSPPINSPERKAIIHAIIAEKQAYEARIRAREAKVRAREAQMQAFGEEMKARSHPNAHRTSAQVHEVQMRRPKSKSESSVHLANAREDLKETLKRKGVVKKVLEPKTTVKSHETSQRHERQSQNTNKGHSGMFAYADEEDMTTGSERPPPKLKKRSMTSVT